MTLPAASICTLEWTSGVIVCANDGEAIAARRTPSARVRAIATSFVRIGYPKCAYHAHMRGRKQWTTLLCAVSAALAFMTVAPLGGAWTPPRTPWGDPDLQGVWN